MLIALLKIDTLTQTARNLLSDLCIEIWVFFSFFLFSSMLLSVPIFKFYFSGLSIELFCCLHISKLSRLKFPGATLLSWNYRAICIIWIFIIFLMKNVNKIWLTIWSDCQSTNRTSGGIGLYFSQTCLNIRITWRVYKTHLMPRPPFRSVKSGSLCRGLETVFLKLSDDFKMQQELRSTGNNI